MTPPEFPLRPTRRIDLSGRAHVRRSPRPVAHLWVGLAVGLGALGLLVGLFWPRLPDDAGLALRPVLLAPPVRSSGPPVLAPARMPALTPAPLPAAIAAAPTAAQIPPQPTLILSNDDLVPVVYVQRGGTLWDLGVARVGRNVPAVIAWIRTMQRLNGLKNPHRIEPGPLILPEPDRKDPVFMRRADLEPQ